jgi:hypothetical protein
MKLIITESQYNRLLLNEGDLSLYKDNNLDMEVQGFDKNTGTVVLKPDEDQQIEIMIRGWVNKPILFNFIKVSPFITDLKTKSTGKKSEIIRPNGLLDYTFTIPKTKTGTFTAGFTFVYEVVGSSTQVTKSINIPFYREGKDERLYACKQKANKELYNEAINWWKNWLNNQSTKDRFAKTFGYNNDKVNKIFGEYFKKMENTTLVYTESDKPNGGWANSLSNTISINCSVSAKRTNQDLIQLFVHEIQHILSGVHSFYPGFDIKGTFLNFKHQRLDIKGNTDIKVNDEILKKTLTSNGFTDRIAAQTIKDYKHMLVNDLVHIESKEELMSTLSEVRRFLKLKPNEKITKEMLIRHSTNVDIRVFMAQWLHSGKSLVEFLNFNNSIAMQKTNTTDRNLA